MAKTRSIHLARQSTRPLRRITLRVTLRDIHPPVWREIDVPDSYALSQLHRCIQLSFNWLDYHLYEFQFKARRFEAADPEAEGEDASRVLLRDLELKRQSALLYIYDMGDMWRHDIVVRSLNTCTPTEDPDLLAYLVDGARAAPPEDAGGPPGYANVLAMLSGNRPRESELVAWLGPGFDPNLFDLRAGNHSLVLASAWGVI